MVSPPKSLADAVRDWGPVPAEIVPVLAAGLAEGLAALHAAGLVHGNLNPWNILLGEDGPRLADSGTGRSAEEPGSAGFGSPEQALGYDAGPPSDIFSLGAVLVFAATGQGPFGSGSSALLMYRLVNSPAELGGVPAELRAPVEACLAKEPGRRPSASRLLADLGSIQPDRPPAQVKARPEAEPASLAGAPSGSPGVGPSRPRRSRPWAAAWMAGGLLAASAAAIFLLSGGHPVSSTGHGQPHAGAALPAPEARSHAPLTSISSPSAPSKGSGSSGAQRWVGITPSTPLSSPAFLGPAVLLPSASQSPSATPSSSPSRSASPTPSTSASASPSPSASKSPSPSPSPSPSASKSASPSPSPSPLSSLSSSPAPSQTAPAASASAAAAPTASP